MLIPTIYTGRQNGWLPSLFSELFDNDSLLNSTTFGTSPAINVSEDSKGYKVEVAAPGMTKDDFAVSLAPDDTLIISMEKKTGNVPKRAKRRNISVANSPTASSNSVSRSPMVPTASTSMPRCPTACSPSASPNFPLRRSAKPHAASKSDKAQRPERQAFQIADVRTGT